ncbi:MAG: fumarylacetoacetate hydrolase family protein [Saprospiraceae bacterium]|nr:fumarylacetoacetate hydrolase family protein [Saprospiraceae bacterium]
MKNSLTLVLLACLIACNPGQKNKTDLADADNTFSLEQLADSVLEARQNHIQTDILSRHIPNLEIADAYNIQLSMLEKELQQGAKLVGWKLGGTATKDSTKFKPAFGYMLDRNLMPDQGTMPVDHFPGGSAVVEAEIGFVIKEDMAQGVQSVAELIDHIDYVVGAIEIAQATAISANETPLDINYVIASGLGHVGIVTGKVKLSPADFDFENETAKCYINDELVVDGISTNIFGTPINALYEAANLLAEKGHPLKTGDLVITGSLYTNPRLAEPADIRVEFSTLGSISLKSN